MRLYIVCKKCKHKTYLNNAASDSRVGFARYIHSKHFDLDCDACGTWETHSVNDVCAEGSGSAIGVFVLVLGLWASLCIGPVGLILGGAIGAVVGAIWDSAESTQVREFNTSVVR